jgi:type II secretory pathway component GspD/PulD (secretin)
VIGGLTNENQRDVLAETPFFSSIPLLGELFKRKTHGTTKRTLYVFITPYIVADERFTTLGEISIQKKSIVEKQTKRSLDYLPFLGYRDRLAPTTFRFHRPSEVEKIK